jgi:hypothetical protein
LPILVRNIIKKLKETFIILTIYTITITLIKLFIKIKQIRNSGNILFIAKLNKAIYQILNNLNSNSNILSLVAIIIINITISQTTFIDENSNSLI